MTDAERHRRIDDHAEMCILELSTLAMRHYASIVIKASWHMRSAGQKRRWEEARSKHERR